MARSHVVKAATPSVLSYQNRNGDIYYLHEGKTKTGKPRFFFAKTVREGALAAMPEGLEVSESINGVVSVRRKVEGISLVAGDDVKIVEAEVARHPHLRGYMVRVVDNAIVIFEPHPRPGVLAGLAERFGAAQASFFKDRMEKVRYAPVMKFEWAPDGHVVRRMTYRGEGGWSHPLAIGKLEDVAGSVVSKIGTDAFFELF